MSDACDATATRETARRSQVESSAVTGAGIVLPNDIAYQGPIMYILSGGTAFQANAC
jgi:hypothetical protein